MRLIDADAYKQTIMNMLPEHQGDDDIVNTVGTTIYGCISALDDAPTIEPESLQPQWIPVTERMPQEHQIVVGWTKDNPFSCYREEVVTWNGKGWVFVYAQRYVTNVKYWMPLPEPYKEEHDD